MLIVAEFSCQEIPQTLVILTHKSTNISFSCALNSKSFGPVPQIFLFSSFYVKKPSLHKYSLVCTVTGWIGAFPLSNTRLIGSHIQQPIYAVSWFSHCRIIEGWYNLRINYPCDLIYFSGSEDRRHHCQHTFLSSQWVPFLERSI